MSLPFDCISDFMFFETELEQSDVILIPGASHPQLMERAATLYHNGIAQFILPSGGTTPHVESTEWEFLKNVGVALGVPSESLLKEDKATNTFENARFSMEVLQLISDLPFTESGQVTCSANEDYSLIKNAATAWIGSRVVLTGSK